MVSNHTLSQVSEAPSRSGRRGAEPAGSGGERVGVAVAAVRGGSRAHLPHGAFAALPVEREVRDVHVDARGAGGAPGPRVAGFVTPRARARARRAASVRAVRARTAAHRRAQNLPLEGGVPRSLSRFPIVWC